MIFNIIQKNLIKQLNFLEELNVRFYSRIFVTNLLVPER